MSEPQANPSPAASPGQAPPAAPAAAPAPPAADLPPAGSLLGQAANAGQTPTTEPPPAGPITVDAKWFGDAAPLLPAETVTAFGGLASEIGLTADQAQRLAEFYASQAAPPNEATMAAALQTEWGKAYGANLQLAGRALAATGLTAEVEQAGLGNHPVVAKLLHALGSKMAEGVAQDRPKGGGGALTPEAAKKKIDALYADPAWVKRYTDAADPGHDQAVQEMRSLSKTAYQKG